MSKLMQDYSNSLTNEVDEVKCTANLDKLTIPHTRDATADSNL